LPIGDDAAAWKPSRSHLSVITTDALVEDVHFTRNAFSFEEIGYRALASNLSDIAAMGAMPVLATIALGIGPECTTDHLLELYRGIDGLARGTNVAIVGGDIVRAQNLTISITIVGEVRASNMKRRSGARARDILAVTGTLGASRAGLDGSSAHEARAKHRTPVPRIAEGRFLGASRSVHAMMDLSDGIAMDVPRLARASGLAATIDRVPVAPSAEALANSRAIDPQHYALEAGEDFELLAAISPRAFGYLSGRFEKRFGRPLYPIGHLYEGSGVNVRKGEILEPLAETGWDHLAQ
jgi:thiamine-monophosphate kinase